MASSLPKMDGLNLPDIVDQYIRALQNDTGLQLSFKVLDNKYAKTVVLSWKYETSAPGYANSVQSIPVTHTPSTKTKTEKQLERNRRRRKAYRHRKTTRASNQNVNISCGTQTIDFSVTNPDSTSCDKVVKALTPVLTGSDSSIQQCQSADDTRRITRSMSQSDNPVDKSMKHSHTEETLSEDDADRIYNPSLKQLNPDLSIQTGLHIESNGLFSVNFCQNCCHDYLGAIKLTRDYGFCITNSKCKSITLWCKLCKTKYQCKDKNVIKHMHQKIT